MVARVVARPGGGLVAASLNNSHSQRNGAFTNGTANGNGTAHPNPIPPAPAPHTFGSSIVGNLRLAAVPTVCVLALWSSLNTGPWNLDIDYLESGWTGLFNAGRAALPLIIMAAWLIYVLARRRFVLRRPTAPEALWIYYAVVMTLSGIQADPWFDYIYWGLCYLAVFAVVEMYLSAPVSELEAAASLNRLSWLIAAAMLVSIVVVARNSLFQQTPLGLSAYDVTNRMPTVSGMPMARATGISRFAAVPAIIAAAAMFEGKWLTRAFWAAIFLLSSFLLWTLQSRGSLTSFVAALAVVALFSGRKARITVAVILVAAIFVVASDLVSSETLHHLYSFATRGQSGSHLSDMSGRLSIFRETWQTVLQGPIIGFGPQADRRVVGWNSQNGILYALLCGGFLGGAGFIGGLLVSWWMLIRMMVKRYALPPAHRMMLVQAAGILTFFTVRLYPENAAAVFSADLLLQLPAIVYIAVLNRSVFALGSSARPARPYEIAA